MSSPADQLPTLQPSQELSQVNSDTVGYPCRADNAVDKAVLQALLSQAHLALPTPGACVEGCL